MEATISEAIAQLGDQKEKTCTQAEPLEEAK
jgi:hypothetical protein